MKPDWHSSREALARLKTWIVVHLGRMRSKFFGVDLFVSNSLLLNRPLSLSVIPVDGRPSPAPVRIVSHFHK